MRKWYHLLFLAICAAVFLILWAAPPEKTARLPRDADHATPREFSRCPSCHLPGRTAEPMPDDHFTPGPVLRADHAKCYMCHKAGTK
ncbi:MAG: hypothetical protein HY900_02830 [Deltaproteobacteria bacterium]|nr:hypothetical protein [Deltaproteobacteria bacterium]